jgi:nitroreductase
MDIDYLLTSTRSVRKSFDLSAPVDPKELRECLRIGCQAANGTNMQTWRWLVIRDQARRAEIARVYRDIYNTMTGGHAPSGDSNDPQARLMASVYWLVEHLVEVPVYVIPCYQPYMPGMGNEAFQLATTYGSIFPAVWNFLLALHSRGYGSCITTMHLLREEEMRSLLGVPEGYIQACLLPVGRLPAGKTFKPAPRRPIDEVVAVDRWDGPSL